MECIQGLQVSATLISLFIYVNLFENISNWTWNIFEGNRKNKYYYSASNLKFSPNGAIFHTTSNSLDIRNNKRWKIFRDMLQTIFLCVGEHSLSFLLVSNLFKFHFDPIIRAVVK